MNVKQKRVIKAHRNCDQSSQELSLMILGNGNKFY